MKTVEALKAELAHLFRHAGDNAARHELEAIMFNYYQAQNAAHAIEMVDDSDNAENAESAQRAGENDETQKS